MKCDTKFDAQYLCSISTLEGEEKPGYLEQVKTTETCYLWVRAETVITTSCKSKRNCTITLSEKNIFDHLG